MKHNVKLPLKYNIHETACVHAKLLQLCLTLCDPMDSLQPYGWTGSSVHGTLQARILEQVAMLSSRELFDPGIKPTSPEAPALQADFSLLLSHWRRPPFMTVLKNKYNY